MAPSLYCHGPIILPSRPHHTTITAPSSYRHSPTMLPSRPHRLTVMARVQQVFAQVAAEHPFFHDAGLLQLVARRPGGEEGSEERHQFPVLAHHCNDRPGSDHQQDTPGLGPSSSLTHARLATLIDGGWRVSGAEQERLRSKAKVKHESRSVAHSKNACSQKPKLSMRVGQWRTARTLALKSQS